jgi:peptide deformylase
MSKSSRCLIALFVAVACKPSDKSLEIQFTNSNMEVVQHIPVNQQGREQNALYLPPRSINIEEFNTPELTQLMDSMYAVMVQKAGVGIAANQLGKRLQIFIIEAKADNPRYRVLGPVPKQTFINPIITSVSEKKNNFWHGCLSAAGEDRGNVATYDWLTYTSLDENGALQTGRLDGFAAVIFQHEFKHLMGGTYLDVALHFLPKPELDQKIKLGQVPFFEEAPDTLPLLIGGYKIGETLDDYHARAQ